MGYPNPLKVLSRKLADNIVVAHSGFKRVDKINFGARMALFNFGGSVVVWSAIPHNDDVVKALQLVTGTSSDFNVSHLIIPDKEHTMAAKSFKEQYPDMKIIAMEGVDLGSLTPIDYRVTAKHANQVIGGDILREIGITDPAILSNFEFVYLPNHVNKELVMYDKVSKTLFEADLLFNLREDTPMEQFDGVSRPFSGWSYLAKFMNPDSKVGGILQRKAANVGSSKAGLRAIYSWDFDRLVMCHGNIIETGGKEAFAKVFGNALN